MNIKLFGRQYIISKVLVASGICVLVLIIGLLGYFLSNVYEPLEVVEKSKQISDTEVSGNSTNNASASQDKTTEVPDIQVYVVGCVNKPGVVTLKKGQIIDDAVKAAGGVTKDADVENINLAFKLNENVMLKIKTKYNVASANNGGEKAASKADSKDAVSAKEKTTTSKNVAQRPSKDIKSTQNGQANESSPSLNKGIDIIEDSLGTVVGELKSDTEKGKLVNINKATSTELENLPNIGPSTAKAIIDYREKNGPFQKVTDIMKITGIKQKTFDKIKDFIIAE